jgi:flagellar FliL protein
MTIGATVAVMAVAAFFVTRQFVLPNFAPGAHTSEESAGTDNHEEEPVGEPEVYLVESLLVNPTGTSGKRYLSTSIGLEVVNKPAAEALASKDLQVRDLLISILSSRSVAQLTSSVEREQMRKDIQTRLNKMLGNETLSAVYFVDYVMQ